jgi:phage terminase large subunit-like protein
MNSPSVETGGQLPSVKLVPTQSGSDGDDATFLAAAYGLVPDPWQELVLGAWLGRRPAGKWSSPRCGLAVPRQNGKNALLEVRELYGMIALGERFLHTAHEVKTARKAFQRLCGFFENERKFPELAELVRDVRRTNGQEAIVLQNGGSVEFIARSKSSGRGYSVDVLVMDEAQELSEDALAALLPTISAASNPQTIMTGTPPGPSAVGEVFTRTRKAGVEGDDVRLCWLEWSCDESADLDDVSQWHQANPALGVRLDVETVADERSAMDDETFARERLGVWDSDANAGVIDIGRWFDLEVTGRDRRPSPVVFTVEVPPSRRFANICMAGVLGDRRVVQVVETGKGTRWVADRVAELRHKWSPLAVGVDPGGPAGSLLPALTEAGIELVTFTGREYAQGCGLFTDMVDSGQVGHTGQDLLRVSLEVARRKALGDSSVFAPPLSGLDIAPLKGCVLALFLLDKTLATPQKKRSGLVVGLR